MSYQSNSSEKNSLFFAIVALFLIVFGFSLFASFEEVQKLFLHLSPDRSFMPFTLLTLRTSFLSFGLVGVGLLLFLFLCRGICRNALERIEGLKESNFILLFLGLAFFLRIVWILLIPTELYADWRWYDKLAYHMSQVWRYEINGVPTAYWPIGYPLFLAIIYWIFGHNYFVVEFINVLLSLCICLLTYCIAKRVVSLPSSRLTLLALAIFPSQIFFTSVLASEIVFTVLLLLSIHFLLKQDFHSKIYLPLITGILLGLMILVRAVALFLPVIVVFFYFKSRERSGLILRNTVLTIMIAFLTLFPWMLRNKLALGSFTVATSGGINLYIGNSPISSGSWVWQKENPFKALSASNEVENDRLGYKLATQFILQDPLGFVIRGIKKEIYLFVTDNAAITKELDLAAQSKRIDRFVVFGVVGQVYYLLILLFSVGGVILFLKGRWEKKPGFYLLCGILIYWMAICFIFFGVDRFHFPLVPVLSIFACGFLVSQLEPTIEKWSKEVLK
jgi:4-amino-4-deoxy-L-arabinose transferase-like glycosyltransferase